jgi:hypothetical protein
MKVLVYPADRYGCGYHRIIWPAQQLIAAGHQVEIAPPGERNIEFTVQHDVVVDARLPEDVDVIVFQRVTHLYLSQAISLLRGRGYAVVVDVDDDLTSIHPENPAWEKLHPRNFNRSTDDGQRHLHSWQYLNDACRAATLVTTSTPKLLERYAKHGRGHVLLNYLAPHYYGLDHVDSNSIVWPASLHSHPNDPEVVGSAISRLVDEGARFTTYGKPIITAARFGISRPTHDTPAQIELEEWPTDVGQHGIGIAPLADTLFNASKSWLKPLEMSAVGVPWVASPRAEYARLHRLGAGVLADKPKHWYREVKDLWLNEPRRRELSEAGRAAAEQLRLEDHAWRWWEAWSNALTVQRSGMIVATAR